tara:strand:- start:1332 stop:2606 length:1275 start_codon:yes stop_codon:yes gene_type:complete
VQEGLETRLIIHKTLKELKVSNLGFDEVFEKEISITKFSTRDKKFIYSVVLSAMRNYMNIDIIIKKFTKNVKKSKDTYFLLLSSITQLLVLNYKEFAVVNSTVELAKNKKINANYKLINAVLRNIIRRKKEFDINKKEFSNLPSWFKNKVKWSNIVKNNFLDTINQEPDLHLVYKDKKNLNETNFDSIKTTEYSLVLKNKNLIKNIDGYAEGKWWVQNLSAMIPIYSLNDLRGKKVLDLCAAPGGKSFQLISKEAKVTACEINKKRVDIMKSNLKRLNINCDIINKDIFKIKFKEKFDFVFLDSPCSSIGTIRRHPEIFYRNSEPDFDKIINLQKKFLDFSKKLIKKNGYLIYMVCSFIEQEGKLMIDNFLKQNQNFNLEKFCFNKMKNISDQIDKNYYYVVPKTIKNGVLVDGFFAAKIKKND